MLRTIVALGALAHANAQCGPDDIQHVHSVCCPAANSCANDLPATCSGDCSSVFLDFADQCQDLINSNPATQQSFSAFAAQCRASFGACATDANCGSNAVCLNMLGCTVPPCSRCLCSQGYEGDGHTCTIAPPPPPPPAPDILSSRTAPTPITAGATVDGEIQRAGHPGFYTLTVTTGVAYTITVTLGDLDDSVLEVWKGPRNAPTLAARNDDANGGLGSQVDWTPSSPGEYFIIVRGFSQTQRGSYTITIATDSGPNPDHGGDGNGDPCSATGAVLSRPSGNIDFSHSYSSNTHCSWKITCRGHGHNPHVHFTAFDTEANFDFLSLYSGESATSPPIDGIPPRGLSGTMPATTDYESATNSMYLQFTSDGSVAGQGFSLRYDCGRAAPPPPPLPDMPAVPIRVGQTLTGTLQHAGDINFYTFQATAGTSYEISTELTTLPDSVLVLYGSDRSTELAENDDGPEGPPGSPHNTASYLVWSAPSTGTFYIAVRGFDPSQHGGFSLTLASGSTPGGAGSACSAAGSTLSNGHGSISFTADMYTNNAHCDWRVTCPRPGMRAAVTFRRLDVEQGFDNVKMYEGTVATGTLLGTLTGTLPDDPNARHFEATGQSMLVEFTSDASVGGNGFEAQYSCAHTAPPNTGPTDQDCTPVRVNSDRPTEGHVDATAPTAYFCLTATAGATYDLTVTLGTLQDSVMDLYGADRRTSIAHNDDSQGSLASFIQWTAPSAGTFYIGVRGFQPQLAGDFSLDVTQETDGHGNGDAGHSDSPCLRADGTGGSILARRAGTIVYSADSADCQDNCQCDWTIQCHDDQVPSVTFTAFQTEAHWDFVHLFDGPNADATEVVPGGLSGGPGNGAPPPGQSYSATQSSMLIEFTSDQSLSGANNFQASFECGPPAGQPPAPPAMALPCSPTSCAGTPVDGSITSGPMRYSFSAAAGTTYQIRVVLDTLPDSVLDLYAADGVTQLAENDDYGASLASYIEWTAPRAGTYIVQVRGFSPSEQGGFTVSVTAAAGSGPDPSSHGGGDPCADGSVAELGGDSGTMSYQPAGNYGNGQTCIWHTSCRDPTQVPTFTFTALDTENGWDFVSIKDGPAPCTDCDPVAHVSGAMAELDQRSYQVSGNDMTIVFTSDNSVGGSGFAGTYSCAAPQGGGDCNDHIEQLSGVGACDNYLAQGYTCEQRFCPTCSFSHMCDRTCGICH
jgi:hypothetical protein